ncbi:MAG: hypothetical protein ACM3O3_13095 [Syntrophothermus sp.]
MKAYENLSDLINNEYFETDKPDLLIKESNVIEEISKIVISHLEPYLKAKFSLLKQKKVIKEIEEDYDTIETLKNISDDLLLNIDKNHGKLEFKEENFDKVSKCWNLYNLVGNTFYKNEVV